MEVGNKIPCTRCEKSDGKICGMCNGCGVLRYENCSVPGYGEWSLYIPNCITKEEAEIIMLNDFDKLCNNFGLTD